jgi:hypothetical protein
MTHAERLAAVLAAFSAGPLSIAQVSVHADVPMTSAWKAVADLLLAGKIVFYGYRPSLSYKGGAPVKLYALASHGPHGKPLVHYLRKEKNAKRTEWREPRARRNSGSGVVAGRITIGRGAKWGAGLV